MTTDGLHPVFAPHHADLCHELTRRGFTQQTPGIWTGRLTVDTTPHLIKIDTTASTNQSGYPLNAPKVWVDPPSDDGEEAAVPAATWHQNTDGSLCLYSAADPGVAPWFEHGALLERIAAWIASANAGWEQDTLPDLDLHRYWPTAKDISLIIHPRLDEVPHGTWISFERSNYDRTVLTQTGWRPSPRRRPKNHRHLYGKVLDAGELDAPPRSWVQLSPRLDQTSDLVDLAELADLVEQRRVRLVLVRFTRAGHRGVLCLDVAGGLDRARSVECAEASTRVSALRQGPFAAQLQDASIAIIGAGAVGSYSAVALAQAGLGRLTLIDPERLRPGNLTRHAAPQHLVGCGKATAITALLTSTTATECTSRAHRITTVDQITDLADTHDIVIDCTGNPTISQVLAACTQTNGGHALTAYLANQGRTLIIDVAPNHQPQHVDPLPAIAADTIEAGCGDPISPTPPYAVQELAALVTRTAAHILTHGDAEPTRRDYP